MPSTSGKTKSLRKPVTRELSRIVLNVCRVFAGFGPTLGAAIAYCETLFKAQGPIQLLSGHKAKGLEWDTVYHLDPHRIPSPWSKEGEALEQEKNVRYVIETQSKGCPLLCEDGRLSGRHLKNLENKCGFSVDCC